MKITYRVVITGISTGFVENQVNNNLAALFKTTIDKLPNIFSQKAFVVKKGLDLETAKKYQTIIQKQGCECVIEPEQEIDLSFDDLPASPVNLVTESPNTTSVAAAPTTSHLPVSNNKQIKFCHACGYQLPASAKFCRGCSAPQTKAIESFSQASNDVKQNIADEAKLKSSSSNVNTPKTQEPATPSLKLNASEINSELGFKKSLNANILVVSIILVLLVGVIFGVWLKQKSSGSTPANTPATLTDPSQSISPNQSIAMKDLFGQPYSGENINTSVNEVTSPWFQQAFKYAQTDYLVFFTKTLMNDPETGVKQDCHACAPFISAITYKLNGGKWEIASKQLKFTEYGQWGDVPEINEKVEQLKIGPNHIAFLMAGGGMQGGYIEEGNVLFTFGESGWRNLGLIITGVDNSNPCDNSADAVNIDAPGCWSYTGKITTRIGKNLNYYDLIVVRTGTDAASYSNNKTITKKAENALYKFDGKKYIEEEVKPPVSSDALSANPIIPANSNLIPIAFQGIWTDDHGCKNYKAGVEFGLGAEITPNTINRYEHYCSLVKAIQSTANEFSGEFSCAQEGETSNEKIVLKLESDGKLSGINENSMPICNQ